MGTDDSSEPVDASTPSQTEETREDDQTSPGIPVLVKRPSVQRDGPDESIGEVVDSYMETLAQGTVGYRTQPKFKERGSW